MKEAEYIVVFVTAESSDEARHLSQILLKAKKAACVNIVPGVQSFFWWEGRIDAAGESLLIIKSKTSLLPEIIRLVKENHRNTVPEIIALPIIGGNEDYLNWIDETTA